MRWRIWPMKPGPGFHELSLAGRALGVVLRDEGGTSRWRAKDGACSPPRGWRSADAARRSLEGHLAKHPGLVEHVLACMKASGACG